MFEQLLHMFEFVGPKNWLVPALSKRTEFDDGGIWINLRNPNKNLQPVGLKGGDRGPIGENSLGDFWFVS